MTYIPKIGVGYNLIRKRNEIGEFVELFFPYNPNQQYAALVIILELKWSPSNEYQDLKWIMEKHCIPTRIFERSRLKLHRMGILEHVTNLSGKTNGKHGWKLSSRFINSLRMMANKYSNLIQEKNNGRSKRDFAELNYIQKKY